MGEVADQAFQKLWMWHKQKTKCKTCDKRNTNKCLDRQSRVFSDFPNKQCGESQREESPNARVEPQKQCCAHAGQGNVPHRVANKRHSSREHEAAEIGCGCCNKSTRE